MGKLYMWANPVHDAPFLDHTWVTTYPFTNGEYPTFDKKPKDGSYWYSWGEYHPKADGGIHQNPNGAIGNADGDIEAALKIAKADVGPPKFPGKPGQPQDGAIEFYAVDGVCQNLANQVMYATGSKDKEPVRVANANGYQIATFFYGNYGLNSDRWKNLKKVAGDVLEPADDFSTFMHGVLGDSVSKIKLLEVEATRELAQLALHRLRKHVHIGKVGSHLALEAELGVIWLAAFLAVDHAVGRENFFRLFPSMSHFPDTEEIAGNWIDRHMLGRSYEMHRPQDDD